MCFPKFAFVLVVYFSTTSLSLFTPGALSQVAPPAPATPQMDSYPDNVGGLKHLVKDIMKAQQESDIARAGVLLNSFVIPNYEKWYQENFDEGATARVLPSYQNLEKSLASQIATFLLNAQSEGLKDVEVFRFDKNCDDNASEQTFNTLDARLKQFPLYELRMFQGNQFKRLFAFAYIDGGFRFVLTPDFSQAPLRGGGPSGTNPGGAQKISVVKQGGAVTAASLINRVQPVYPEVARQDRLSGTVRLHAIIDKEGNIKELRVISGRCSLARASVDAVRRWRYRPTLLLGQPVEVDTTIDVIFALSN